MDNERLPTFETLKKYDIDLAYDDIERIFTDLEPGESGALAAFEAKDVQGSRIFKGLVYFPAWDESDSVNGEALMVVFPPDEADTFEYSLSELNQISKVEGLKTIDDATVVVSDSLDNLLKNIIEISIERWIN